MADSDDQARCSRITIPLVQNGQLKGCDFRALVEQALAGIYVIQGGAFSYVNDQLLEIFGCTREDMRRVDAFLDWAVEPADRVVVRENIRRRLAGEIQSLRYVIRGCRKDGTALIVEVHGTLGTFDGRPAIIGMLLDRTAAHWAEEAFKREHGFIAAVLDTVGALVIVLDRQGRVARFNRACETVTGYAADEILGLPVWDRLLPAAEREAVRGVFASLVGGAFPSEYENRWLTKAGGQRLIAWTNTVLLDVAGEVEFVIGTGIDVTERRQMEAALRESEARLREITSELGDGIYVLDRDGHLTFMNRAAERMLGWREGELMGRNAHEAFHYQKPDGSHVPVCDCPVYRSIHSGETYRIEEDWFTRKDGGMFPVSFVAAPLHRDGEIIGSVAAFQETTERKRAQARIQHLAHHDTLTDLPNRALFTDRLQLALAQARRYRRRLALMFLDLDGFKGVNDTLGHDMGDELLKIVAARLRDCVREADTVARLGGDEFVILLPEAGEPDAVSVARKVIESVHQPMALAGGSLTISTSVGVALHPDHGEDAQTLMKHADMAMYQAKDAGRNGYRLYGAANTPQPA